MTDFMEEVENKIEDFRRKSGDKQSVKLMFETRGSSGSNPVKLAQNLSAFDMFINIMGWQDRPLADFSKILTGYQASVEAQYHKDYKDVLIAEEIERKRAERKGISILQQ